MRFALVDGHLEEAKPDAKGTCPLCGAKTVAKCGDTRIWHWAHYGRRTCDQWWENETDWHRNWKDQFPLEWQEVIQHSDNDEKHIADVKTPRGWVVEFQHSFIKLEERHSREAFYGRMVWVIDGLRRKNDHKQFIQSANDGTTVSKSPLIIRLQPNSCRIVEEWSSSQVGILIDFGSRVQPSGLLFLVSHDSGHTHYVFPVRRSEFVDWMRDGPFPPKASIDLFRRFGPKPNRTPSLHAPRPGSFEAYKAELRRSRARRRF